MKKFSRNNPAPLDGPLLDTIKITFNESANFEKHPFSLPIIKELKIIEFPTQVTFFVGENGSGKSTILEAIAHKAGFGAEGGSKNFTFKTADEKHYSAAQQLADQMTCSWRMKPKDGYFFRAESFYNVANFIDAIAKEDAQIYESYGGKSLHLQSHGESFLAFFKNRVGNNGFFVFDEPEAALSPQRQLALLAIMHDLCKNSHAQFIIATHSPILLAYPNATIYSCDEGELVCKDYAETQHYQITKDFLDNPKRYLSYLFSK